MATYVSYTVSGIPGSIAATLGIIIPGIILVTIITAVLGRFAENKFVTGAFYGLRPASIGLITAAGILVAKVTFVKADMMTDSNGFVGLVDYKAVILALILLALTRWIKPTKKLHPVVFIAMSAIVGIVFAFGGA